MRRVLFAAVASAPLILAGSAFAATVINTARTTPVQTSTANNGAPDDVTIEAAGSVRPTSGVAVTLDSNNSVTNAGTIGVTGSNDSAGLVIQGGRTGTVINRGTISVVEDYTPTDSDSDGDLDGVFAQGLRRYGVRLTGPGAFTGSITNEAAGRITVEGQDSFGVSLESALNGAFTSAGTIEVLGDRSRGVSISGPVSGAVTLGSVSAQGQGAVGVDITGAIGGALVFGNTLSTSGYRSVSRPTDTSKLDADDLLQGGPAARIAASVAGGVLVDAPPPNLSPTDTDEDKDGVLDAQETTAVIESFGGAPGMLVAAPGAALTLGATAGGGAGLLIRGRVAGTGVYDGVSSTGLQIGDAGAGAVTLTNGLRVTGTLEASAAGSGAAPASATGLRLVAGAAVPTIALEGVVRTTVTGSTTGAARTVLIEQGATASVLRNTATAQAVVQGTTGDAILVEDRSGTLTTIENTGRAAAGHAPGLGAVVTGRNIAFDLTANTSGVSLRQSGVTDGDDGGDGVADLDADADGVDDADEPSIIGDVLFGSGADRLEVLNGELFGAVAFGAGADTLIVDGGARVTGAVTDSDGGLALDVRKGTLELTGSQRLNASSLNVGAQGALVVTLDPASTGARVDIGGAATFASGSRLGVRLTSLLQDPARFTVVRANTLNAAGLNADLSDTPFLFVSALTVDQAAGAILIDVRRRTAAEAGLNRAQSGAFDAVYAALGQDAVLRTAFLRQTTQEGLLGLYEQVLPEHAGGALYSLATAGEALSRAVRDRAPAQAGPDNAWVQEVGFRVQREAGDDSGFDGAGFGLMGGLDTRALGGQLGISAALLTSELDDDTAATGEDLSVQVLEGGLYWRGGFRGLTTSARGALGWASFNSDRRLSSANDVIERSASAEWTGLTASAHLGAAYRADLGRFYLRPEAALDALTLREGSYDESGGGVFDLSVEERTSHLVTGTGQVALGARFGGETWVAPELIGGWRQVFSGGAGDTVARFSGVTAGAPFTIRPADAPDGTAVIGFGLTGGNAVLALSLQARAEVGDDYEAADLRLNLKFVF